MEGFGPLTKGDLTTQAWVETHRVVPGSSKCYLQQLHCRGCPVATAMPGIFVVPTSDVAVSTPLRMTTHIPWLRRFHTGPFADGEHITFAVASGKWWIPFFCDDCMKFHSLGAGLENPETIWFACRLPPCGYLVTLHNITVDHHPSSNLALHWPSRPSKKTTPSCQVDLLICTQKTDWLKISPICFLLVPWGPWLIGLIDAERHVILIERMPLNKPFYTPLKLTSLLQKWCKLGISHG